MPLLVSVQPNLEVSLSKPTLYILQLAFSSLAELCRQLGHMCIVVYNISLYIHTYIYLVLHISPLRNLVKSNDITLRLIVEYSLLYVVGPEKGRWVGSKKSTLFRNSYIYIYILRRTTPGAKQGCSAGFIDVLSHSEKIQMYTILTVEPLRV